VRAEFVDRDIDVTMAILTVAPYGNRVPNMAGGSGAATVRQFHADHFIVHWPADAGITLISRMIGQGRVIDELLIRIARAIVMGAFCPAWRRPTSRACRATGCCAGR
jgi:carboxymethylenebutenolidase